MSKVGRKSHRVKAGRGPLRTARLNLMIEPGLKRELCGYAKRKHKSISAIVMEHFVSLLEKEKLPDIEQI
jgi:hypothetical protein